MFFFWWQGKGFFTALILLGIGCALALLFHVTGSVDPDGQWFPAIVLILSAPANWWVGSRLNAGKRATIRPATLRTRLTYRARNRFMSLPMESWSVAMAILAAWIAVAALVAR